MEHHLWARRTLISAAVASSIGLTACSGGGGDSAGTGDITPVSTTTLSGIVADGYLVNATVCLDLDLSKTCDLGEPTATSTTGGSYSLDATQAQIDTYPIVAKIIAGTTVDEDNPSAPVAKAYTLSAPAGKGAFVSPLTTMVQAQIETSGKTAEQIENEILVSIGQDPTVVSLFDDYVAQKTDINNSTAVQDSYLQLHQIAQVTAATIANNIEMIEAAISNDEVNMDLSTTLDSLITIIVQNVIAELTAISSAIDSSKTFDANAVATSVDTAVDTATIEDQIAVAEAPSVDTSDVQALFTAGISWMWAEFGDWGNELERSLITYDAATGTIMEPIESYFETTTPGWTTVSLGGTDQSVLQSDGTWKAVVDSWDGSSVTFNNTDGTATIDSHWGKEVISNIRAIDLAGLNIKQFVANKLPDLAEHINSTAVFTSGSESYSMSLTSISDSYSIWVWYGCDTLGIQYVNGNCNTVVDYSGVTPLLLSSLTEVPIPIAFDPSDSNSYAYFHGELGITDTQRIVYELVQGATSASGTTNYYLMTFGDNIYTKVGTGTWSITAVNGTELLMVDHPDALMSQYLHVATHLDSPEENHFYVVQDGVVRLGDHWPANIVEDTAESLLANQQAQADMTAAFLNSLTANPPPAVTAPTNAGIVSFKNFSLLASDTQPMVIDPITGIFTKTDVTMTVFIGDRDSQLLTDSHTVFFNAEYGLIDPSCVTVNGSCSVTWSAIKRPDAGGPGDDMRVTIIAYTIGEESFTDTNGNGVFDDADSTFTDIEEPYIDADESNSFTMGDVIVDVVNGNDATGANQTHDIGDGFFNGPGCTHSSLCSGVIITNGTIWNANTLKIDGP